MWPRASSICWYPKKSFPVEKRAGRNPSRPWTAATGAYTLTTCCRPTRAPISTSWSARAARSCRATTTEEDRAMAAQALPLTSPLARWAGALVACLALLGPARAATVEEDVERFIAIFQGEPSQHPEKAEMLGWAGLGD